MYATINFKTKAALKAAVKDGAKIRIKQAFMGDVPRNGVTAIEGPWYPQPHTWYATVKLVDGIITSVK